MSSGAGQLLALGFEGPALPETLARLAADSGLGGVVLFRRNCPDLETVLALTAAARRLGPDVLILVDHEGGRVHRLPPPFTHFPPAATLGRTGDPQLAEAVARAMARELRAAGFDSGLAPVLDCLLEHESVAIGDRAYGSDPETVAAFGIAFVRGALAEGLVPVAKHFPGHGRTALDSHLVLPEVRASRAELERVELAPFRRALTAGCPAVLVAHVRYRALDPDWPASLSGAVLGGLLRRQLGFEGMILSDDLEMAAVRQEWGVDGAAVRFLLGGGDLALVCRDAAAQEATVGAVSQALDAGELSAEAASAAWRRRCALRGRVEATARPSPSVIGCEEHQALLAEVLGRTGNFRVAPSPDP